MAGLVQLSLVALASFTPLPGAVASQCKRVKPVSGLNITEYTRASWYVQEQQETSYQEESQLNCVVATYDVGFSKFFDQPPFFRGPILSVYNYNEGGQQTLDASGTPANRICASMLDASRPSRLLVAPCFLPPFFSSRYWVVGFGIDADGSYDWALVSGGPPRHEYEGGCTTGTGYFNSGLWILSRQEVIAKGSLAAARARLTELGYTLELLKPVRQANCTYEGAYIKP